MKKLILYFTFLLTSIISPELRAQQHIHNISWDVVAKIPPAQLQSQTIGLAGAITGSHQHLLFIAGGTNFPDNMPWEGGKKKYYNDIFIYRKMARGLVLRQYQAKLPFNLAYAAVCSTPGGIVIAGGENETGLSKSVFIMKWENGQLTFNTLADLPAGLTNAALTLVGDILYLAGGETGGGATDQFLLLDLKNAQQGWKKLINLPQAVSHSVLLSAGTKIFMIGGRKSNVGDTSTIYKNVWMFDVNDPVWKAKAALPNPLAAACGITAKQELLVFSGDEGKTFHQVEKLIGEIDREKDPERKAKLNQSKAVIQAAHPGFSQKVLKYNIASNTWTVISGIMPYGTVTTQAVWFGNEIIIAGGEIKAGVRTPKILSGKIKVTK
ncbi:Kelch repeat-containing protein [Pedobacter ghigonis]|uniref:Kelch repeat-containing protein n=1 Tax=Pedobacter ghigonis TaxID=2730403 RepID=UPI00158CBE3A|nr:hypothetical protein [Pedobacter ghigonis]